MGSGYDEEEGVFSFIPPGRGAQPVGPVLATTSLSGRRENGDLTIFEEELWARFGPTECEDFNKTSAKKTRQGGSVFALCLQTPEQENQLQVHEDMQP